MQSFFPDISHKHASNRIGYLLIIAGLVGLIMSAVAIYAIGDWQGIWVYVAIFAFFFASIALVHRVLSRVLDRIILRQIWTLTFSDRAKYFMTDELGRVVSVNPSARCPKTTQVGETLHTVIKPILGNPHASLSRLRRQLFNQVHASEIVLTQQGQMRLSAWRQSVYRTLWRIEEITQDAADEAYPATIPAITVSDSGSIQKMNALARALLGTRVSRFSMLVNSGQVQWNAPNEVETTRGKECFFLARRKLREDLFEVFLLPEDVETTKPPSSEEFYALPVPMIKLNLKGVIVQANEYACELFNISEKNRPALYDIMEGLGRSIPDWIDDALQGRGLKHPEFLRLHRRDKEVFVQVSLNRITNDPNASLIAILSDATELKTLEAQFVQSQKMQAIGQLAGGVAHDFNNLLTAISGHCDLLLLRHDTASQDYADLVQINQNANRAAALVSQLLAFSRKQTLRPEPIDMRDTLADLMHLLNRLVGEKVELVLQHDNDLQPVRADKRQLEQVFMNLVVNARDAMPEGGRINIKTNRYILDAAIDRDHATIPAGEYVSVSVSDAGCGIAKDKLTKIFEPFYSTKRTGEGTGLGLSTVYGIVKQTGGYIFVDSEEGQGTEFNLILPVFDGQVSEKPEIIPKPNVQPRTYGDGVILLVEDEAPVRTFASRALQLRGYQVIEAASAEDALEILNDPDLQIDVFVTDIVMPGRDGPSWVKEALEKRPNTRVVFVSGYAEDVLDTQQAAIPNSVFLPKPFSLDDLTETVQQQFH